MRERGQRSRRCEERGFTIIELLVSLVIIGILCAIVIPAFMFARYRAVAAKIGAEEHIMENAAITFNSDNSKFPDDTQAGEHPGIATPEFYEYISQNDVLFDQPYFQYDWENWSGISPNPDHLSTGVMIGFSVVPKGAQPELVSCMYRLYGDKLRLTLSNHYTFVIEPAPVTPGP